MRIVLGVLGLFLLATPVSADILKVASWNIQHLRDLDGEGPRPRMEDDYRDLRDHARRLNADVIAVQEVENELALGRVFDSDHYAFFVSNRRSAQRTGFAVKKSLRTSRYPDVNAFNTSSGMRYGVDIGISLGRKEVRLLSIHLKSGCFQSSVTHPKTDACKKLAKQVPVLERWIDDRVLHGMPFIVLGDFNRRFDAPRDDFWREIDDGDPVQLELFRTTAGLTARCHPKYRLFIDHIVFGGFSRRSLLPGSFEESVYPGARLSDHCPISVKVDLNQ